MNSLSSKPFAKKTFYIDLKGFLGEKKLIKDLELLGGKQEVFLSKTVSFVVSNRISFSEGGSPSTPLSSIKSISPYFLKDSSLDNKDSPASNSPIFETKHHNEPLVPLSRGMSVLQKAREKCQGNNKFVLDICKQWNIKVYPVQKVLTWIEKYKTKYFKHGNTKSKRELTSENVTKLYSPCIKIEDNKRKYKPRYKVFSSWVESIDSVLLQNTNKLALNFKQFGNIDCSTRPPLKEIFRQPPSRNVSLKSACLTQAIECSESKGTAHTSSKVAALTSFSNSILVGGPNGKHADKGSRSLKTKKEKHAKKRKLYCEICGVHYNDGEAHYEKNPHARFLNNSANYTQVQKIIDALPTVDDFLNSLSVENASLDDKVSEIVEGTGNLNEEPIDKCLKSNEKDSCMTEEYILNENDYISASCSSGGTPLPFLEKEERGVDIKDVNSTSASVVNDHFVENRYDYLNPPLLLPENYDVPLDLGNNSMHAFAAQNGDENAYNGLERNSKLIEGGSLVGLHGNCVEISRKENCFENNLLIPASLAPGFSSNFKGNEINVSCLEQSPNISPQSVINWNGKTVEQPLDLSNYSMNNENIIINEKLMFANSFLGDNGKDFNMINGNSAYVVTGNTSLNSLQVNATVNEKSEDESFDSDPNLAGFDAVINNCLEEVTKSLLNDTSTTEEDEPTNELKFPNPTTQSNKLIITCAESFPQAESFKEHTSATEEDGPTNELNFPDPTTQNNKLINPCAESVPQADSFKEHTSATEEDGPTNELNFPDPTTQNNKLINPCAESVPQAESFKEHTSTAEEDGPTNELTFPDPTTQSNKLIITCAESVPQAESFKEHLLENLIVNQQPNGKLTEQLNAECDAVICVSVNNTHPDFFQTGVESTALFPLEPSVASKEETENTISLNNQDENMLCDGDVSEKLLFQPLNSGEDSERLDGFRLSNFVKCIQAKVSSELLHSDDAYLVLDEADFSFDSVKDGNHAVATNICNDEPSDEANTLESLNKVSRIPNDNKAKVENVEHTLNKAVEHNVCDSVETPIIDTIIKGDKFSETECNLNNSLDTDFVETPVIDTIIKGDKFSETECNLNNSLDTNVTCTNGIKERVDLNETAHSITDVVCKIQKPENIVVPYTEEFCCGIKENAGICEHSFGSFKKISEKETKIPVYEEMELSCETIGQTGNAQDTQCIKRSAIVCKVCVVEGKDEIYSNEIEDSLANIPNGMSKNEKFPISGDKAEYFCQTKENASADGNESKCSVKRPSESEEPTCKKMKISLNDSRMDEKLLNAFNNEHQILSDAVRDEDSENNAKHSSVSEMANNREPCVLNAQIPQNCDGSNVCCANDSLNSSSSSWESSFSSSNESNGSLLASSLPCISAEDTGKPALIVYLNTPMLPTSTPLKQGNI